MPFWQDLSELILPGTAASLDAASAARIDQANRVAAQNARAGLFGGISVDDNGNPIRGTDGGVINWNAQQAPTGNAQVQAADGSFQTMPVSQVKPFLQQQNASPQAPLFDADTLKQYQDTGIGGIMGALASPDKWQAQRAQLMAQADPNAAMKNMQATQARQAGMDFLKAQGASPDVMNAAAAGFVDPEVGKALAANLSPGDAIKQLNYLTTQINALPNSDPRRAILQRQLDHLQGIETDPLKISEINASINEKNAQAKKALADTAHQTVFAGMPDGLTGEDAYQWVSNNVPGGREIVSIARKVVAGQMLQPSMERRGSMGEKVGGLLAIAEPLYNQQDMKARYQLNQELTNQSDRALGGKLNSVSKIVNHSVGLLGNALDLNNGSLKPLNYLSNLAKSATSNEALSEFKKNQEGLGNEFEKFSGGGVAGQQARNEAANSYSPNAGITETIGSVGKTLEMMEGQLDPMVANYNRIYNTQYDTDDFIRNVMNQPKVADQINNMKSIVGNYRATGHIDAGALALLTGRQKGNGAASSQDTNGAQQPLSAQTQPQSVIKWGRGPDGRPVPLVGSQ